jgi:leucyl-tRNA synthetase
VRYDEPFEQLLTQGMVLNHIFSRRTEKGGIQYYAPEEIEIQHDDGGRICGARALADDAPVAYEGIGTMSKSKRNGVDPQALIEHYGADTARFFMMFASPPEQTLEWSDSGVEGAYRFLRRLWTFGYLYAREIAPKRAGQDVLSSAKLAVAEADTRREIHAILRQANFDIARFQFNTVASAAMKILNALERAPQEDAMAAAVVAEGLSILLRLLSPITPHICDHLWRELGFGADMLAAEWPEPAEAALVLEEVELVLQVNGKMRGNIRVPTAASREEVETLALASEAARKYVAGAEVRKVVVVPGRLVNIVAG